MSQQTYPTRIYTGPDAQRAGATRWIDGDLFVVAGTGALWVRVSGAWVAVAGSFTGDFLELAETVQPAAPAANSVRIYAVDNGAGRTQLMALFATGDAQQIAIQVIPVATTGNPIGLLLALTYA